MKKQKFVFYLLILCTFPLYTYIDPNDFRDYENAPGHVKELYYQNHTKQTLSFVLAQKRKYLPPHKMKIGIWQILELLDNIIDISDPDLIGLSQINHALQTAEAIRVDGHPRWLILTGLIHDLGKVLYLFDEPQWAIVGDTFPVGCPFADTIIFSHLFAQNPDTKNPLYQTPTGIYEKGCGLHEVHMSWGHDEYLYHVVKDYIPEQAAYIIRYHSFYAQHKNQGYDWLLNEYDQKMMKWIHLFNRHDLYSKSTEKPDVEKLKPYYQELIAEYFPEEIWW